MSDLGGLGQRDVSAVCAQLNLVALIREVVNILFQQVLAARVGGKAKVERLQVLELNGLVNSCSANSVSR